MIEFASLHTQWVTIISEMVRIIFEMVKMISEIARIISEMVRIISEIISEVKKHSHILASKLSNFCTVHTLQIHSSFQIPT